MEREGGSSLAGRGEGRWLRVGVRCRGVRGNMGSAAGTGVGWDLSTGPSCTGQRMSSQSQKCYWGLWILSTTASGICEWCCS